MKSAEWRFNSRMVWHAVCAILITGISLASTPARKIPSGEKAKVKGQILSRSGEFVKVHDSKDGSLVVVDITDNTKVERKNSKVMFFRHADMDVTAMLPGLTIEAEGTGNAKGQLEATKISFTPDDFAIEVAEEQQIQANKTASSEAQTTANKGVAAAGVAQTSADQAQVSANQAATTARAAGDIAVANTAAMDVINQRVSDLGDYQKIAEAGIYYPVGAYTLDDAAKAALDHMADLALQQEGYMIEIAGYASKPGTKEMNQQLSEDRANAVAQYLRNQKNIPMRRILAPAGYGASHPDAPNTDAMGRELNRRVDVIILVNKGLNEDL
jgi:outer membrane protein OmpA-like peptidoglycan-associated protein